MAYHASSNERPLRSRHSSELDGPSSPSSPGSVTPPDTASPSSSTFLTSSVSSLLGGLIRRFSGEPSLSTPNPAPPLPHARTFQPDGHGNGNGRDGVYTPPHLLHTHRTASPMRPPPLEPLQLVGFSDETGQDARLLTPPIAEEIRIMVPARLGIVDEWRLVYSLEQDGASLATLYEKCARYQGLRVGFVLCVKDCEEGLFGAYLSDHPHPAPKYFGTGECFLWRVSIHTPLPPPPSSIDDTTTNSNLRTTTISAATTTHNNPVSSSSSSSLSKQQPPGPGTRSSSTPQQQQQQQHPENQPESKQSMRFKAFPYSGINEYYMLCEPHFLSLGAGDGRYGLWLDDSLERGVSSTSQTFGNEPLSDEGEKFGVLGVEVWVIGA
ncbi:TLD-domain-containing protein [Parathielavia appendiculata]|uniref:Oxidation resistance protein 1 n=1 Tax=Parathielavia appendiculata TaxID=2587402 RepID=A0AAN6Z3E5_9PEZI|nr:TLD-domain-containing protein [Parathielavia appendiculata]